MWDLSAILQALEIASIICAAILFIFKSGRSTESLGQAVTALRDVVLGQGSEIKELRSEMKQFGAILTQMAVQKERIDMLLERVQLLDDRYEELRHGEGFVYPLTRAKRAD